MAKKPTKPAAKQSRRPTKPAHPSQIYELKITLRRTNPPIWRRIAVPSDIHLSDLSGIIQVVMGWTNSHLHQFVVRNARPKPTSMQLRSLAVAGQSDRLVEYMRRDRILSDPRFEMEDAEDERKVKLNELAPTVKSKFVYEYDFGDGWEHLIEVVKVGPPAEGVRYPVCLNGKLACPPEDCGGVWGYYEMLDALDDPKHERHEEFTEWLPFGFDPERFDLDRINKTLAKWRPGRDDPKWMFDFG